MAIRIFSPKLLVSPGAVPHKISLCHTWALRHARRTTKYVWFGSAVGASGCTNVPSHGIDALWQRGDSPQDLLACCAALRNQAPKPCGIIRNRTESHGIAPQITAWACIFPCVFAHWATESPQPLQLLIILIRKNEHMHGPFQAAWEGAWVVLEFLDAVCSRILKRCVWPTGHVAHAMLAWGHL